MDGRVSPTHSDFLPQFKAIGQSLKKRFFRKPNVADAIEQYNALCQELKRDGQDEFAAVCAVEAAKCHESLQNHIEFANTLVKAANYYLQAKEAQSVYEADENVVRISCRGKLQLAMQYLETAARVYKQQQNDGLSFLTLVYVGQTLFQEKEYGESLKCFKHALESASIFTFADQLVIVESILACKVKLGELESGSKMVNEYLTKLKVKETQEEFPAELYLRYTLRFEIMRVYLILILGSESADLAKFIWPESSLPETELENVNNKERQEVMVYLKSLVIAVENGSVEEIIRVRDHLSFLVSIIEFELFSILVKLYS